MTIETIFHTVQYLNILCLIQGIIFGLLIINLSNRHKPLTILGIFILLGGFNYLGFALESLGFYTTNEGIIYLNLIFILTFFPLIYLYIKSITSTVTKLDYIYHLAPGFFLFLATLVYTLINLSIESSLSDQDPRPFLFARYLSIFITLYCLVYLFNAYSKANKSEKLFLGYYSYKPTHMFRFLKWILKTFILLFLIILYVNTYHLLSIQNITDISRPLYLEISVLIIDSLITYSLLFFALKHGRSDKYSKMELDKLSNENELTEQEKLEFDEIYIIIIKAINTSKCFKDQSLTIANLTHLTNIPYHKISQAIRYKTNSNYHSFINRFRVEEAKNILLLNGEQYTIDGIGQKVGFRSKSAFYAAFKKIENTTPLVYLKKNQNN